VSVLQSSPAQKEDLGIVIMTNIEGASYVQVDDLHCKELLKDLGITRGGCLIAESLNQNHTQIIQAVNLFLLIGKEEL